MLKAVNRLKKKADFQRLYREGTKLRIGPLLVIKGANTLSLARFGVVVSKKVSNKAVVRNKIRRSLSALLEPFQENQKFSGQDFIFQVVEFPDLTERPHHYFAPFVEQWSKR